MLTTLRAGPYTIEGVSLAGVHTSIWVPELSALFDAGTTLRTLGKAQNLFLSHGHTDHTGALPAVLGARELLYGGPTQLYLPTEAEAGIRAMIDAVDLLQARAFDVRLQAVRPGDELAYRSDLYVRVFRTFHRVPSVGYQFLRKVKKLKPEFASLDGREIQRRREAGDDLFDDAEHHELAYATDTLIRVLDETPSLLSTRVLILECTFLDENKPLAHSRHAGHIHLDEILERADTFQNEHLVLMHFSQTYGPEDVRRILKQRCPKPLFERIRVLAPESGHWPG